MTRSEFLIRCRTCDEAAGTHQWVTTPSAATRGRWASEHRGDTGHNSWACWDGDFGSLTWDLTRQLDKAFAAISELAYLACQARLEELENTDGI